ncbi:phosphorylated adapter RNA export protein [Diachasmimorpha longicaudata]|uniref:phosphorylated adapter RNA export protein n=1 Tax=Diachasmimorpha longicaudata TaxID=58733 RepID=UPI0030B887BC
MEAESLELEDGEVVDDEPADTFGPYNVLQRPHTVVTTVEVSKPTYSDDTDETSDSASDTDSDSGPKTKKRPKLKAIRRKASEEAKKTDKYKIWCTQVQEEVLTEDLVSCGVTRKMHQGRSVENYDLPVDFLLNGRLNLGNNSSEDDREVEPRRHRKRTNCDRKMKKLPLGKRRNSMDIDKLRGPKRTIDELSVGVEGTDEAVARDIAEKLNEKKDSLIRRVVDIIGKEKAIEFYYKTKDIESDGGMLIMNGSRRRTPGGVYLHLVKTDDYIPQENIRQIFFVDKKECTEKRRADQRQQIHQQAKELMKSQSGKDLPTLMTRVDLAGRQIADEARQRRGLEADPVDSDRPVSNPPPSPVTDDPDHAEQVVVHHQRRVEDYSDDFLDLGTDIDTMEMF